MESYEKRLKDEGNETVTNCHGLKLKTQDGKNYNTDVVDIESMFRTIESIPSKNVEPIKGWLYINNKKQLCNMKEFRKLTKNKCFDLYNIK